MPTNPFASSNPFAGEDWSGVGARKKQQTAAFKPLPEPEAETAKDTLVNKGLSGLSWVGNTLDKAFGARAIRGAAMGDLNEVASVIPFSDTLGITDPKNAHSMDDVLQKHNIVGKNDPDKWEARDFIVPAASILADPGTYLSFGSSALTGAGKIAKNAGVLPKAGRAAMEGFHATEPALKALGHTDDMIAHATRAGQRIAPEAVANAGVKAAEPLQGLVGVGLPFQSPAFTLGHGKLSQKIAGGFDDAKAAIKTSKPVAAARALFDPEAGRSFDPIAQQANEIATRPTARKIQADTARLEHQSRFGLEPVLSGPGVPQGVEREAARLVRQRAEKIAQGSNQSLWEQSFRDRHAKGLTTNVSDADAVINYLKSNWDTLGGMGDKFAKQNKEWLAEARRMGGQGISSATANQDYLARQYIGVAQNANGAGVGGAKFMNPKTASDMMRKKHLRDIPGGTEQINDWAINPALSGPKRTLSAKDVRAKVLDDMVNQVRASGSLLTLTEDSLKGLHNTARGQAGWLGKLNPVHAEGKVPFFDPDPVASMAMRGKRQADSIGNIAGLYEGAARAVKPVSSFASPDDFMPLGSFLEKAGLKTTRPWAKLDPVHEAELAAKGLTPDAARELVSKASPVAPHGLTPATASRLMAKGYDGAAVRMYEQLARHGEPLADFSVGGNPLATLNKYGIAHDQAAAFSQFMPGWSPKPHELHPLVKRFDSATNLFKNMVYPLWPASHVRNATSAIFNNAMHGTPIQGYMDAAKVIDGKGIDEVAKYAHLDPNWATMAPEARSRMLHELAFAHAKVFQGAGGASELVGKHGLQPIADKIANGERLMPHVPGDGSHLFGPRGVVAEAKARGRAALDPRGQAGVFGQTEDTFAPLVAGRRLGTNIEDNVRMSHFLGELRKGATPEAAAEATHKVHFDYGDLTRFEKETMRRAMPFYTFARKNAALQADILSTQPGNLSAPIKALTNAGQGNEGFTPEYLSSGVAIPMGEQVNPEDGRTYTRYVNKVGLPFEEALDRFKFRNGLPDPVATMRSIAGSATPYIKAPIEMMTDTQLHSGRRLSDLRSEGVFGGLGMLPPEVSQPLTQILANSPLARFGTTADKLIDSRKGPGIKALNLLTGIGITDVDREKLREVEARREVEAALKRDPAVRQFTNLYVPAGQAAEVSPQTAKLMQLYTGMKDDAKGAADERAKRERDTKMRGILGPAPF